jgi:hypothetical protein
MILLGLIQNLTVLFLPLWHKYNVALTRMKPLPEYPVLLAGSDPDQPHTHFVKHFSTGGLSQQN